MSGWIKLHRQIRECSIWESTEPFDSRSAWIDMLLSANHEDREIFIGGQFKTIREGSFHTSQVKLAERWRWKRDKVESFLKSLIKNGMITCETGKSGASRGTTITIVKYGFYQDTTASDSASLGTSQGTTQPHHLGHKQEVKNNKEHKNNIYADSVEEIFRYLNDKTGKNYTGRSKAQRDHIIARLKEGYTVEEFKKVIDNKTAAWKGDPKMDQYLRPETLFSTKFETYLNDTGAPAPKKPGMFNSFPQRDHDDDYFANLERKKLIGG